MKKLVALFVGVLIGWNSVAIGATILFPSGGGTGTSTAPSYGQLLVGNRGGTYTLTATSSLGITGTGGGGSGVGTVATSSLETKGGLPYWTTTSGYPATLGSVATTTVSCSGSTSCTDFTVIGSSPVTISSTGGGAGDVVNATGTPGQIAAFSAINTLTSTSTANFSSIDATSTTRASLFETLSIGNGTSSTFAIANALNGLLKTDGSGSVRVATAGTDYQAALGAGTKGQILAYLGAGVPTWTATTTFNAPLSYSAGAVSCTNASSGVTGCLTGTDWDTFNGKESALTFGTLLTRSGNTISGSTSPSFKDLNATSSMTIGTLSGVLKAASGLVSTGSDGTDYTLIDALTCSGTDKFSGVTAAGVFTCSADVSGGASSGFIVNATGTPAQLAVFSGLNSLISTSTINVEAVDATSTSRFSVANLFRAITAFALPNGTGPTVDAVGEMAIDTTDNQLLVGDSGGTPRSIPLERPLFAVTIASTSPAFLSGATVPVPRWVKDGRVLTQFRCWVEGGTSVAIQVSDGTNATESITCATTVTSDTDVATNDTFTADEKWYIDFGTVTGTVDYVTFEAYGYITNE